MLFYELLTRGSVLHANNESKGNKIRNILSTTFCWIIRNCAQIANTFIVRAMRDMWTNDSISLLMQLN